MKLSNTKSANFLANNRVFTPLAGVNILPQSITFGLIHMLAFSLNFIIAIMMTEVDKIKISTDFPVELVISSLLKTTPILTYCRIVDLTCNIGWPVRILNSSYKLYFLGAGWLFSVNFYTLVLISLKRYRAIIHPIKGPLQRRRLCVTCAIVSL